MYAFFKKICQICDGNLVRNVDYLVQKSNNLNYSDLLNGSTKTKKDLAIADFS